MSNEQLRRLIVLWIVSFAASLTMTMDEPNPIGTTTCLNGAYYYSAKENLEKQYYLAPISTAKPKPISTPTAKPKPISTPTAKPKPTAQPKPK
eukprot:1058286_1